MKSKIWNKREYPWLFTHLQKSFHWKVNGTRLSGSFQRKICGSNGTSEKVVLFFRTELMFQTEICVPFLQGHVDTSYQWSFSGKRNLFVQMVNAIPGQNLPVLNLRTICPNSEPTGLPR